MTTPNKPNYKCDDKKCCPDFAPPHAHLEPTSDAPRRWWLNIKGRTDQDPNVWWALLSEKSGSQGGLELVEASALDAAEREIAELKNSIVKVIDSRHHFKACYERQIIFYNEEHAVAEALRSEVVELKAEVDRLKDIEFMYNGLCK